MPRINFQQPCLMRAGGHCEKLIARMMGPDAGGFFEHLVERLIEILVATGHRADAEKICAEAVLVVDDPRLKCAVTDAELKPAK